MKPSLGKDILDRTHTGCQNGGPLERPEELLPVGYDDWSGRPQGAPTADYPRDVFDAIRPHTPPVKYIPGGQPHLPQIIIIIFFFLLL